MSIISMNYPNQEEIIVYDDDSDEDLLAAFFDSDQYQQIKSNDLQLLTDDINKVRRATNNFISLSYYLSARPEIEIPRLRANALEIIELIGSEYGR